MAVNTVSRASQPVSVPLSRGFNRGIVELELLDENGQLIDQKVIRNSLSYEYRNQLSTWLSGSTDFVTPTHIAVGTGVADTSLNQKTIQTMSTEVARNPFAENLVMDNGVRFRAVFKGNDFAADIRELMLFGGEELAVALDNCNSATGWSTGTDQTLSVDVSERQEGTGSLSASASGVNPDSRTFYSTRVGINLTASTVGVNISTAMDDLQFWLYVDDITKMTSSATAVLSSSTADSTNQWAWTIATTAVANGWTHLQLPFNTATITGSPDSTNVIRFELVSPKNDPVVYKLDRLRTFGASEAVSFARTEFTSAFTKQIGSTLNITWTILPDYEDKANTFYWDANNTTTAVVADVHRGLTQSGAGSFPTTTSSPWNYSQMWKPAASGYMTVPDGTAALDTLDGSVAFWMQYPAGATTSPANGIYFDWRQDSSNYVQVVRDGSDAAFVVNYVLGGSVKSVSVSDAVVDLADRFVVATWDNTGLGLSVGTVAPSSVSMSNSDMIHSITNQPTLGGRSGGTSINYNLGPVLFFNQALSTAEIANLATLGRRFRYGEAP